MSKFKVFSVLFLMLNAFTASASEENPQVSLVSCNYTAPQTIGESSFHIMISYAQFVELSSEEGDATVTATLIVVQRDQSVPVSVAISFPDVRVNRAQGSDVWQVTPTAGNIGPALQFRLSAEAQQLDVTTDGQTEQLTCMTQY